MNSAAFLIIGIITLSGAFAAATLPKLIHAALSLVVTFVGLAAYFFLVRRGVRGTRADFCLCRSGRCFNCFYDPAYSARAGPRPRHQLGRRDPRIRRLRCPTLDDFKDRTVATLLRRKSSRLP